ncbi:uncharacterized protein METZ01_LOCUS105392, partial [marine metagenome]
MNNVLPSSPQPQFAGTSGTNIFPRSIPVPLSPEGSN